MTAWTLDVLDGDDELNQVIEITRYDSYSHFNIYLQADFKEAVDGSDKKMVRDIFKVKTCRMFTFIKLLDLSGRRG